MMTSYYLHLDSRNLAHYFVNGIIAPAIYLERRSNDVQSTYSKFLLLSKSRSSLSTGCCLEIIFTDEEKQKITSLSETFSVIAKPVPVSRIKAIWFSDEEQKNNTIFDIESGAAFLPKQIIKIDSGLNKLNTKGAKKINLPDVTLDFKDNLSQYQKVLGGLALMRIASTERDTFPEGYYSLLSFLSAKMKTQLETQGISGYKDYTWAINKTKKLEHYYTIVNNLVTSDIVKMTASDDSIKINESYGVFSIDEIPPNSRTYLTAVLATYGKGRSKKIDDFIYDLLSEKLEPSRKEGIALAFGVNQGYRNFRNKYEINGQKNDVKFKLDSQLDYYIIESVYQFVFNEKTNSESYPYIDSWCPKLAGSKNKNVLCLLDQELNVEGKSSIQPKNTKAETDLNHVVESILDCLDGNMPLFLSLNRKALYSQLLQAVKEPIEKIVQRTEEKRSLQKTPSKPYKGLQEVVPGSVFESEISYGNTSNDKSKATKAVRTSGSSLTSGQPPLLFDNSLNQRKSKETENTLYKEYVGYGITQLKEIARNLGVPGSAKYRSKDKDTLIDEILKRKKKG